MLRPIAPFVEYAINKDYIAEYLCVNKDKPEMHCNGKCYLYKELKNEEKQEQKSLQISLKEYPIGFINFIKIDKKDRYSTEKIRPLFYNKNYSYCFSVAVFHPPCF